MSKMTTESVSGVDLTIPAKIADMIDPSTTDIVMIVPESTCVQCNASKRSCDKYNVRYTTIVVSKDDEISKDDQEISDFILAATDGVRQLPFVINAHDVKSFWSGFNSDMIKLVNKKSLAA